MPSGSSLQWRATIWCSALLAVILAAFLAAAYRQVERTLIESGEDRARAAARALSAALSAPIAAVVAQTARVADDPAIRALSTAPSAATRADAGELVARAQASGARRFEVWDLAGTRLLDVAVPGSADALGIEAYPDDPPPDGEGVSEMRASGAAGYYFTMTAPIRGEPDQGGPLLGRLKVYAQFSASSADPIRSLLGEGAVLRIGTSGNPVWTDLSTRANAAPMPDRIGAAESVNGTPWIAWVGYPHASVIAPARDFLWGALPIALGILLIGIEGVRRLTGRLTAPIVALSAAAEAVAAGDYSRSVDLDRRDEIGTLGNSFNTMTSRLAEDSAARQSAERALRDSEADFRALFGSNPLPMWVYDRSTLCFLEVNAAAVSLYGYSRDDFLVMRITDIRPPEAIPALMDNIAEARENLSARTQWRHRIKDGTEIDVDVTSHLLTFEGRESALVVAQDVSARTLLEQRLRQAHKMEAVGQLAGGVAHDFNNLLTVILGYGELLMERLDEHDERRADLREIQNAGRSAADLTRQLLAFSRKQILQPEVLDLNAVVAGMQGMLSRIIGEQVVLETSLSPTLTHVLADRSQLEQIIMNLAVNGRDAMPDGGRLTIETSDAELDEHYVRSHRYVTPGLYAMVAVTDGGIGMDAPTKAHMFEPFFTTKKQGEGTGLGLATIYGIVKQSGGSIEVYSEPGLGTTFKVFLPSATQPPHPAGAGPSLSDSLEGSETILVVEDQSELRAVSCAILRRHGYQVIEAASGQEALALFNTSTEPIALLLTDLVMPDMTGVQLVELANPEARGVRVLYTSGYADESIVRSGLLRPGVKFLQKPFAGRTLLRMVRQVLAERRA